MNFEQAFERLLGHEGGYSNDPRDPGGETMYGITLRVARLYGYTGPMELLSLEEAKFIAREEYWNSAHIDDLPDEMAFDMFDASYHSSSAQAIKFVQRATGVEADGVWGPKTATSVAEMEPLRLLARFNGHRLDFLNGLPAWAHFGKGWAQRIAINLINA